MKKKKKNNNPTEVKFIAKEIKRKSNAHEDYNRVIAFLVVIIIIGVLLFGLYFFNAKFVTKDQFQGPTTTTTTTAKFDDKLITIQNVFGLSKKEYYVLLYDTQDVDAFLYSNLVSSYNNDKVNLYQVDMHSPMNKKYYNPEGKANTKPTKYQDILITKPTLMVIKNNKVTSYITDMDKIIEKLK